MHILLIHQAFASINEAGGTRHHELARYLVQRGHRVTIITSPINYLTGKSSRGKFRLVHKELIDPGITILRCFTYSALHRSFVHRVLTFFSFMASSFLAGLSVKSIDLVWGTSPPIFQGFTAWILARLKAVPFLFEVRDLWPAFAISVGVLRNPILIRLSLWLEKFLYRHADRVMVNSPGFIRHVQERGAKTVEMIPNGADPAMFTSQEIESGFRLKYHLQGKFVVVYAGAHGLSNDLQVVLRAAFLLREDSHVQFVLVGDGKEKPNLQKQATEMDLTNLMFCPPVPKSEMNAILAGSDACLAILKPIELYKTTYPNKVFDYMAASRPVILAIDGVVRQVVEDAGAGLFVPPGDPKALVQAIQYLAERPKLAQKMGSSGHAWIETHYNRAQLADKLARMLEDMLF